MHDLTQSQKATLLRQAPYADPQDVRSAFAKLLSDALPSMDLLPSTKDKIREFIAGDRDYLSFRCDDMDGMLQRALTSASDGCYGYDEQWHMAFSAYCSHFFDE